MCSAEQIRAATQEELAAQSEHVNELMEVSRSLSEPGVRYRLGEQPEPQTSARPVVAGDVLRESQENLILNRVPATPVPHMRRPPRGRSPGPGVAESENRSRSRPRAQSVLWTVLEAETELGREDQAIQSYLQEYGTFFAFDFEKGDEVEHICLMNVSLSARKRKELQYHRMSSLDQRRFEEAMLKEWQNNILRPGAAQLISLEDSMKIRRCPRQSKRIIPTRWVLIEKDMGLNQPSDAKARFVVQGFKDPDLGEMEIASPTLHKDSLLLILQLIASMRWVLVIADIKGAFMSSRPLHREQGELYASLPKLWLHHTEANPQQLIQIKVAWYGLNDGPREFYTTLDETLRKLGCVRCPLDPCVYVWHFQGQVAGVIGVTVDDLCCGGTVEFRERESSWFFAKAIYFWQGVRKRRTLYRQGPEAVGRLQHCLGPTGVHRKSSACRCS